MQRYRNSHIIEAAQITSAEYKEDGSGTVHVRASDHEMFVFDVPPGFKMRNLPPEKNVKVGDYLIRQKDGYLSWMSKDIFEAGYAPINN